MNPVDDGFWGHWPMCYDEMPVELSLARTAASMSDTAVVIIGRAAGEDRENKLEKGSYYLTDAEKQMLDSVTAAFDKVVVLLNCGSIIDMSEIEAYGDKISSILYIWQSGMESGNAVADVLAGDLFPCGKLTDTIAKSYYDYPGCNDFGDRKFNCYTEDVYVGYRGFETLAKDRVMYPFGFGLGYTEFAVENINCACENGEITVCADVKNIGSYAGKDGKIDFIQQTGNIKLDFSVEYRTVLLGKLHGAVFVDAGNIWNTRHYADQPGGQFHFDTFYRQIAAAYGVGLRLNLDYFVIRLDGGMKAINPAATGKAHYPIVRPRFSRDFTFHFAVGMPF